LKYTISYKTKFGTLSAESNNPDDLVIGYQTLKHLLPSLDGTADRITTKTTKISKTRGGGETAIIIRELESKLLPTTFFSKPRTTGETLERLFEMSGQKFTSRKVSQALGILWNKDRLNRSGARNYYVYSKQKVPN
jgi:hypothetical protein